jgi:hypothetical protein
MDDLTSNVTGFLMLALNALIAGVIFVAGASRFMPKKVSFNKKSILGLSLMILAILFLKNKYF